MPSSIGILIDVICFYIASPQSQNITRHNKHFDLSVRDPFVRCRFFDSLTHENTGTCDRPNGSKLGKPICECILLISYRYCVPIAVIQGYLRAEERPKKVSGDNYIPTVHTDGCTRSGLVAFAKKPSLLPPMISTATYEPIKFPKSRLQSFLMKLY